MIYYKELNTRIDAMTGGKAMPDVAIESVNFRKAWSFVEKGNYEALTEYNSKKEVTFDDILDFHVRFEIIHPFQDVMKESL